MGKRRSAESPVDAQGHNQIQLIAAHFPIKQQPAPASVFGGERLSKHAARRCDYISAGCCNGEQVYITTSQVHDEQSIPERRPRSIRDKASRTLQWE
jgi:hypothetical protein